MEYVPMFATEQKDDEDYVAKKLDARPIISAIEREISSIPDAHPFFDSIPRSVLQCQDKSERVKLEEFLQPLEENVAMIASAGKRLTPAQKGQIWSTGSFSVASAVFEGQEHVWQLSRLLVKGRIPTDETFFENAARTASLLLVTFPRLLWRRHSFFNFVAGVKEGLRVLRFVFILTSFFVFAGFVLHVLGANSSPATGRSGTTPGGSGPRNCAPRAAARNPRSHQTAPQRQC
jgi:hypothetical protein